MKSLKPAMLLVNLSDLTLQSSGSQIDRFSQIFASDLSACATCIIRISQNLSCANKTYTNKCEPRHDKTCLREFPTRPDSNRPAQPQKIASVLKFRL